MTDDLLTDIPEASNRRADFIRILSMVLAAVGVFVLLTYRNYLDVGQIPLGILYFAGVFVVYQAHKKDNLALAGIFTLVALVLVSLSVAKIFWNKNYLQSLTTANAFVLEDYIERYPLLEEYAFAGLLGKKDWVRFSDECVAPALQGRSTGSACHSDQGIQRKYKLNVNAEIDTVLRRMQRTAKDINDGRIKSGSDYQRCVGSRRCAPIPLLPANVDAKALEGNNTEHLAVRTAFWDLAEEKGLTQPVCEAMILCRAMMATGVVAFSEIAGSGAPAASAAPAATGTQ